MDSQQKQQKQEKIHDVVIVGGGIIGVSSAYYLSKYHNVQPLVLEAKEIAWTASGRAGGFLGKGWAQGHSQPFGDASFDLHHQLSLELNGQKKYQYRKLTTLELLVPQDEGEEEEGDGLEEEERELLKGMDWVSKRVRRVGKMGSEETTAQVHPKEFTDLLLEEAIKNGTKVRENAPVNHIKITHKKGEEKEGEEGSEETIVELHMCKKEGEEEEVVRARRIILCAGAWTHCFSDELPGVPRVKGLYVPSVVVKPTAEITPHAIFGFMSHAQKLVSPEIYPRPDGTVFICGLNDPSVPVPDLRPLLSSPSSPPPQKRKKGGSPLSPSSLNPVPPNLEKSAWLHEVFGAGVSTHIKDGERLISQACFVPSAPSRSIPFIGSLPLSPQIFVAANHGVWGILMGPLTGKMVGLVVGGEGKGVEEEVKKWGEGGVESWEAISSL